MKIAFAASSRLPSKAANSVQVMKMCEAFAASGHQVELFARPSRANVSHAEIFADYGVKPIFALNLVEAPDSWALGGMIFGCKIAARLFTDTCKPDIIYGRNIYALIAGSLLRTKLYYESHAAPVNAGRKLLESFLFALPCFTRLVVINQALHNYYLQTYPQLVSSKRISTLVAHDGADSAIQSTFFAPIPGSYRAIIGYAGGLYPGKGMEIITEAAKALPQYEFRIAGGTESEIAFWKSRYCKANIHFYGFLKHAAISHFLNGCDILLAPYQPVVSTNSKGLGNIADWMSPLKIFEYMASQRPIIASKMPAIEEILTDGYNARLVAPTDAGAWCISIRNLAGDKCLQQKLAKNAAADLANKFRWSIRSRVVLASKAKPSKEFASTKHSDADEAPTGQIKCLHIIGNLDPGGAEKMLCRLVKNSDKSRFQHQVITLFEPGAMAADLEQSGIKVFNLGINRNFTCLTALATLAALTALPRLTLLIKKLQPDLVQTWMYNAGIIGVSAARAAGLMPIISSIRHGGFIGDPLKIIIRAKLAAIVGKISKTHLVTCSKAALEEHSRIGFSTSKALVIPNGFVLPEKHADEEGAAALRQQLGIKMPVPIIGLIGRYHHTKDHANFIKAAAIVAAALPMTQFVMCGSGVTSENAMLTQAIERAGLSNCMHLLGQLDDIASLLRGLTLLVSSSSTEAFANVIGEAMATAVPCVVTDVGDSAHIVGDTGIVVPPASPDALAEGMLQMLSMENHERTHLGLQARNRIELLFALPGVVKQYEKLYLEVTYEQRRN